MNIFSSEAPIQTSPVEKTGFFAKAWQDFFDLVSNVLWYCGNEQVLELVNNQSVSTKMTGLFFDRRYASAWFVDYLIQRVTDSSELVEQGTMLVSYLPSSQDFQVSDDPTSAGLSITVDDKGQALYSTTNQAGVKSLSRIIFRVRSLKGKSQLYSAMGNGGGQ